MPVEYMSGFLSWPTHMMSLLVQYTFHILITHVCYSSHRPTRFLSIFLVAHVTVALCASLPVAARGR